MIGLSEGCPVSVIADCMPGLSTGLQTAHACSSATGVVSAGGESRSTVSPKAALVWRKRSTHHAVAWYADHTLRRAHVTSCTGDVGRNAMNHAAPGPIFRVP